MPEHKILVFGDNHGDTESLEKVVKQTEGVEFDFIIHTGDITNAYKTDLDTGVEQLQAIEPYFERLAERGSLVYIYGNRDKERSFSETQHHVIDRHELRVGHRLQKGEAISVDGQRFTADPSDVGTDDILLTHAPRLDVFYQMPGRAYFCGHTHSACQQQYALDTGYLHNDKGYNGAYFVVTVDEGGLSVEVNGIDEPWKGIICPDHQWYGRQFTPTKFGCRICKFDATRQFQPMAAIAFDRVMNYDPDTDTAEIDEIVDAAKGIFTDLDQYASQFQSYLEALAQNEHPGPFDPLIPVEGDSDLLQSQKHLR